MTENLRFFIPRSAFQQAQAEYEMEVASFYIRKHNTITASPECLKMARNARRLSRKVFRKRYSRRNLKRYMHWMTQMNKLFPKPRKNP